MQMVGWIKKTVLAIEPFFMVQGYQLGDAINPHEKVARRFKVFV